MNTYTFSITVRDTFNSKMSEDDVKDLIVSSIEHDEAGLNVINIVRDY